MQTTSRLSTAFRVTAVVTLLATLALWVSTGAHLGWTQTSAVRIQHDEITGIDFPERYAVFVAGVEVLAAGVGVAVGLGAVSVLLRRRSTARKVAAHA